MLQIAGRPYVCWRCLARPRPSLAPPRSGGVGTQLRSATTHHKTLIAASYGKTSTTKAASEEEPVDGKSRLPIRDMLRRWTAEEQVKHQDFDHPLDARLASSLSNTLGRPQSSGSSIIDQLRTRDSSFQSVEGGPNTGDADIAVGGESRVPGDLVELQSPDLRMPILAIYLGFISGRNHFYAYNGKWITSLGFEPLFTVSNFVASTELLPILARIPIDASPDQLQEMRNNDRGPSRADGADLIRKMADFTHESERIYQSNLSQLDGMRDLIAHPDRVTYLSLFEIAQILLPESDKNKEGGGFPPAALYATHTAIFRTEFGISPLSPSRDSQRRDHLYEILSTRTARTADLVIALVRSYTTSNARRQKAPSPAELEGKTLGEFILKAREVVQASRSKRQWTAHGIVSTPSGASLKQVEWPAKSQAIISFLELWAAYDTFENSPRFHSFGATILRALELYDGAMLDQNTAWTFLQEIGVVSPWEISSRYKVRFPNTTVVKGGGLAREPPRDIQQSKRTDIAAGSRKEWTDATVFCIDSPSSTAIDDGISLERTERTDEFWIHIHTADPASVINPDSELCKYMELIPASIYLPGHFQAMLPADLGVDETGDYRSEGLIEQFSLHSGSPALTFSARVNYAGEILDYKVEPGVINKVAYLDPEDVSAFCNQPPPPPFQAQTLAVGGSPEKPGPPSRPMTTASKMDESSQNDLSTLYRLAEAVRHKRLSKGAWPYFFPRSSVSVSFPEAAADQASEGSQVIPPDPYIKVSKESSMGCSVVSNTMVLAGEIAARWCASRGIAVPFRRDAGPAGNFPVALAYATEQLYPLIEQGIEPTGAQRQKLMTLTGSTEISSEPGPYFLLGLDMYAKATSPLRRFSDLMVHWQIHAALAHERATGRAVDPALDRLEDILPFSGAGLDNTLSLLYLRERMARNVMRGGEQWILQALMRAWQLEKTAPRTMRFTVESNWRVGVIGRLDLFDLRAVIETSGLNGTVLLKNVRIGDQFDVELLDINIHSKDIIVNAISYLGQDGEPLEEHERLQQVLAPEPHQRAPEGAQPEGDVAPTPA